MEEDVELVEVSSGEEELPPLASNPVIGLGGLGDGAGKKRKVE